MELTSSALAAFRLRCWYELGDTAHDHYIQDYSQLLRDACVMRHDIYKKLRSEYTSKKRLAHDKADTLAELLVTALLADYYGRPYDNHPMDLVGRSYDILPKIDNDILRCYLLVLLFWLDAPTPELQSQIDRLMSFWSPDTLTPEDKYVKELYSVVRRNPDGGRLTHP